MAITLLIKMIIGSAVAVGSTTIALGIVYKEKVAEFFGIKKDSGEISLDGEINDTDPKILNQQTHGKQSSSTQTDQSAEGTVSLLKSDKQPREDGEPKVEEEPAVPEVSNSQSTQVTGVVIEPSESANSGFVYNQTAQEQVLQVAYTSSPVQTIVTTDTSQT